VLAETNMRAARLGPAASRTGSRRRPNRAASPALLTLARRVLASRIIFSITRAGALRWDLDGRALSKAITMSHSDNAPSSPTILVVEDEPQNHRQVAAPRPHPEVRHAGQR